ncbi:MAG: hypothetical protein WB014_06370 [Methanosarcina sp.]
MSLRLRQLLLHIKTNKGPYGVEISFEDGLVVIRADNTSGKSTCIQSIIYALGLEKMLSPKKEVPLPPVMTSFFEDNGEEISVLESDVFLEISNEKDERLTIKRAVKGELDTRLVSVWDGPALSNPTGEYQKQDFYVKDPGSATHNKGFHTYLASFLGWDLPLVTTYDGKEVPLYMECIFPLLIVEQKIGWSGIQSNIPTFYRIKEVEKRSIEFLAGLEAYEMSIKKQKLMEEENKLRNEWKSQVSTCESLVAPIYGTIHSLPVTPVADWPPIVSPSIEVYRDEKPLPINRAIKEDKIHLSQLNAEEIPTVQQAAPHLINDLEQARSLLEEKEVALRTLFEEINVEKSQLQAIIIRLSALEEDLRRNKDILKIRKYGSEEDLVTTSDACPVCHQKIVDYLLTEESLEKPMSIDENIKFIESQKEIFIKMKENASKVVNIKENQLLYLRNEVNDIRSNIRALKQTLTSSERSPSISFLRERILLDQRIRLESSVLEQFELCTDKFYNLASDWKSILERKKLLPKDTLSKSDLNKIKRLESLFNEQLEAYGFSSFRKDIEISPDTYKPTLEGFNLTFDVSASDHIRTIWAYLNSLLELSREFETNHLGLLIFDEPRQQDASEISYYELLKRVSKAKEYNQQVIFATSENRELIESALQNVEHTYRSFEGKMIKKLAR